MQQLAAQKTLGEHSSRRQQHQQQQQQRNSNEHSSDIDGTAHRVASVTLQTESDSRTSDAPMSFRSKRRKKLPRREKHNNNNSQQTVAEMEVDEQQPPWKKQSITSTSTNTIATTTNSVIPTCKLQMDWEHGEGSSTAIGIESRAKNRPVSVSDLENNQSDQLSLSDSEASASNVDADDEQSDWPGNELANAQRHHLPVSRTSSFPHHTLSPVDPLTSSAAQKDAAALSASVVKRILHFLRDASERELTLDQVYRTSAVKQMLREQPVTIQIVKRGRGAVALKKV